MKLDMASRLRNAAVEYPTIPVEVIKLLLEAANELQVLRASNQLLKPTE